MFIHQKFTSALTSGGCSADKKRKLTPWNFFTPREPHKRRKSYTYRKRRPAERQSSVARILSCERAWFFPDRLRYPLMPLVIVCPLPRHKKKATSIDVSIQDNRFQALDRKYCVTFHNIRMERRRRRRLPADGRSRLNRVIVTDDDDGGIWELCAPRNSPINCVTPR